MTDRGQPPPRQQGADNIVYGVLIAFALHLLWIPVLVLFSQLADAGGATEVLVPLMLAPLVFIGVGQLLYVGPVLWWARRTGRTRLVQGLLIGAGITFLLNAACWGLIAVNLSA